MSSPRKICYLAQGCGNFSDRYLQLQTDRSDLILLSYKAPVPGAIHAPGTSWNQGRNRLLGEARRRGADYEYYVFIDDDIQFEKGDFRVFEEFLLRETPAIGTPKHWAYNRTCEDLGLAHHTVYSFDACCNAFHKDVIEEGLLLPYVEEFDDESWWYSQLILIHLANLLYPGRIYQCNQVAVRNGSSAGGGTNYPHNDDFPKAERFIFERILRPDIETGWFHAHPNPARYRPVYRPSTQRRQYRVHPAERERLFREDWFGRSA